MASPEITGREWHFEVLFEDGEAPDTKKRHTTNLIYRPYSFTFTVTMGGSEVTPDFNGGKLHGYRVNKGGLGVDVNEDIWSFESDAYPWLAPYIQQGLESALKELKANGVS